MSKYNVWLPYKLFVVKEVEAINKVLDETEPYVSLCYQCMKQDISDDPYLIEDEITAEEE